MAGSTAVIFIKASTEHPLLVASYRLLIAAVFLTPVFIRQIYHHKEIYSWKQFGWTILPAFVLALHFITWVIGARATLVTNASLIINLTPLALPFFMWIMFREMITTTEVVGTILALCGIFILSGGDYTTSSRTLFGDIICFISLLTFAWYFALGRKNNNRMNLWIYVVPMYYIAGLICFIVALFFIYPIKTYSWDNILYILGLGIIPTVIGHTLYNYSLKYLRGQLVGIINLSQPFFSAIFGFLFLGEIPKLVYYLSAILVICGAIIAILFSPNKPSTHQ